MISSSTVKSDISGDYGKQFQINAADSGGLAPGARGKQVAGWPSDSYAAGARNPETGIYSKTIADPRLAEMSSTTSGSNYVWVDTSHYETYQVVHTEMRWVDTSWTETVIYTSPDGETQTVESIYHSQGHWEQYTYTTEERVWVSSGYWELVGEPERAAPPGNTTAVAGTSTAIATSVFRKVPAFITQVLNNSGIGVRVVKESVVEIYPALRDVTPRGHTQSWNTVPGMWDPQTKTIVFASGNLYGTGSVNYRLHEIGHAYDWAMGDISRNDSFTQAWRADRGTLSGYYNQSDENAAKAETFAEGFAAYYEGRTEWFANRPHLNAFFQTMPR